MPSANARKRGDEKTRLTLDLSADLTTILDELTLVTGMSKAEILREGLEALSMSVRAIEKGYSYIGAWDEDAQHEPARAREFALRTIRAVSDKVQRQQHSKQAARASEVGKTDSQGSKDIGADSVAA